MNEKKINTGTTIIKFLKATYYLGITLLVFYVVLLIVISLLVKEEDKSFKNISNKLRQILGTFAMQLVFVITSVFFALVATLPLTYISTKKPAVFSNGLLILFVCLFLFLFAKRIYKTFETSKSLGKVVSSLFPSWFKVIFWIAFTVYFLPFAIGIGKKNIFAGIALFLFTAFFVNVLFYLDRVTSYFKKKYNA